MAGVAFGFQGFEEEPLGDEAGPPAANPKCPEHQYPSCPLPEYVLKIPPARAAPSKPPPGPPPPAECAVSLEFLRSFLRRLPGGASSSSTMAKVVEDLVRPSTGATQSSYASQHFLVPRGHTGPPTWVVVHPWDMPAAELVAALEEFAAGLPPASTYFWIDALAVSQHLLRPGTGPNMAATAQAVAAATAAAAAAHRHAAEAEAAVAPSDQPPALQREPSFSSRMRMQQQAQAAVQELAVEAARREVLRETRSAMAAARCGVLLVVGREARPLRRGWCLLQLAETLRTRGPEAITLLPLEKGFKRADLVRQLRELDVAAVVAAVESWDQGVLAEALGVPRPPAPGSAAALAVAAARASAANAAAAASAAADGVGGMRRAPSMKRSGSMAQGRSAPSPGGGAGDELAEPADGCAAGRALARQLQLALLLRPMDGVLPARIMGAPLPDANPAVYCPTSPGHAAPGPWPSRAPSSGAQPGSSPSPSDANSNQPWAFDWLWDWSAVASWLALPPHHPNAGCLLVTGPVGSGKTTALATLMAKGEGQGRGTGPGGAGPWVSASHFCSAADARSLAVGEVVRSLAYQLACRSPCFGAALVRNLVGLGGPGGGAALVPDAWLHGAEEVVEALLRRPLEQEAELRAARGERPPRYVFLIDGLDEGPAAAAAAAEASGGVGSSSGRAAPPLLPPEPTSYDVLRLVVEHLRQLPNVRLILSCTAAADALEAAPDVAGKTQLSIAGESAAAKAARPAPAPGGAGPASLPAPLVVASRGAVGAAASVHLAARRLLQPTEVPLAALRRDKYLALALAHVLQEFVLSPELTARELLWAARGCLAHVHILMLLVRHAAERLEAAGGGGAAGGSGVPGMADPTAAAAALVTVAEASAARKAAEEEKAAAAADGGGDMGAKGGEELPQRPSTPPPQAPQPVPQRERSQAAGPAGSAASPGLPPHAEPSGKPVYSDPQDAASGLPDEPSQGGPPGRASPADERGNMDGESTSERSHRDDLSPEPPPLPPPPPIEPPPEPPVDASGLHVPNTGAGAVSVHAVPPVCRGSLADEYGVLWGVRTDELRQSALLALLHAAAAAEREAAAKEAAAAAAADTIAAGGKDGKAPMDSPMQTPRTMAAVATVAAGLAGGGGGGGPPKLVRAVSMTLAAHRKGSFSLAALVAAPTPPPPQPPERAARLQLLVDILAAAREPMEWGILARALQAAEPPAPEVAAAVAGPAAAAAAGAAKAAAHAAAGGAGRRGGGGGGLDRELEVIAEGDTPRSSLTGGGLTPRSSVLGGVSRLSGAGALPVNAGGGPTAGTGAPASRLSTNGLPLGQQPSSAPHGRVPRLSNLGEPTTAASGASHDGGATDEGNPHGDSQDEGEGKEDEELGHLDSSDWEEDAEWDSVFSRLGAGAATWQDEHGEGPTTEEALAAAARAAARAAAVLRDLDWALSEEGPLSSLVFVSGSGKVCVRHSSFLEWLRRGGSGGAASSAFSNPAFTPAASTLVLSTPRPHVGHAALARVLRSQMPSGRAAAAAAAATAAAASAAAAAAAVPPSRSGVHAVPGAAAGGGKPGITAGQGAGAAAAHPPGSGQGQGPGHSWGGGGPAGWPSSVGCSGYVLRHVVPHCVEGRLPSSEIEAVVMDLEWVRLLLEGGHVEVVAGAVEQLLRTRGPDAAGGAGGGAAAAAAAWNALGGGGGGSGAVPALGMRGSLNGVGQVSMRVSNLGMGSRGVGSSFRDALMGGSGNGLSPRGGAGAAGAGAGASLVQAGLSAAALSTPPLGAYRGGGGGGIGDGRRLSTAAAALLRDLLRWLASDGLRLWRRPEPLAIACLASLAPMGSPFRRRAEQLTAATVAAAAALAVSAFAGSLPGTAVGGGSHTGTPTKTPPLGGPGASAGSTTRPPAGGATAAARALGAFGGASSGSGSGHQHAGAAGGAEGAAAPASAALAPWPPSHVTALPHPRLWKPEQRSAQCSHRVSALLPSPDGDVMLAAGEWASKATLLDVLTGRRLALLDAGPDSHSTALSAAAFSPDRRLVASAGLSAGSVTLWDAATGTPKACLPLRGNVGDFFGIPGCAGYSPTVPNITSGGGAANAPAAAADAAADAEVALQRAMRRMSSKGLALRMAGASDTGGRDGMSPSAFDDDECAPWVTAIAIHAPGHGASAAAYGAPAGTAIVATVADAAEAAAAGAQLTASGKPRAVPAIVAGSLLMAAGDNETGKVALWALPPEGLGAVRTGLIVPPPPPGGDSGGVAALEFVPGGRTLAVVQSCSTAIRLYSVQSQQLVQTLRLPASCGEVLGIRFAPQPVHMPPPPNAPPDWAPPPPGAGGAYSSYGNSHGHGGGGETLVAAACFTSTQLWSLERKAQVVSLPIGAGADGGRAWATNCVAFSPACGLIATAGALFAAAVKAIAQGNSMKVGGAPVAAADGGEAGGFHEADAATVALIEAAAAAVRSIDRAAVTLWDVRTGGKVATLRGLAGAVRALAFNPDGGILAVAAGAAVSLWSATTGSCLAVMQLGEEGSGAEVSAVAFGRGGAMLSASIGAEVHSWDVALAVAASAAVAAEAARTSVFGAPPPGRSSLFGGSSLTPRSRMGTSNGMGPGMASQLNAPGTPNAAAAQLVAAATSGQPPPPPPLQSRASQLGLAAAAGAASGGGTSSGAAPGRFAGALGCVGGGGHTDRVACACFSPNGSLALTGGFDNAVRMWDVKRHAEMQAVETPGAALGVAWSPDASLVAASLSNGSAIVWYVVTAAMAPSTFGAAAGGAGGGASGGMNVSFGSHEAARFQCSDGAFGVCGIAFTADGSVLATAVGDGSLNLWCTKTWKRLLQVVPQARGGGVALGRFGGAAQTPDGAWVLLGCGREVVMYSVAAGREATERLGPHGSLVNALALSPCGRFVAVAAGGAISVWGRPPSASGGAEHGAAAAGRATKVHRPAPASTSTGSGAGSAGNSHSGEAGAASAAALPENGAVRPATPSSPSGRSSPAATPPPPLFEPRVTYLSGLGSDVLTLAFSHDGAMLAAGHADGSVRVWASGARWREVGWLAGHGDGVAALAFSPDGRLLLSGGWDGRTLCWSMRDAMMPRSSWSAVQ
ncbi:hypothetical protein HXX76_004413 [Chlamydomonas incerta]|uniref:Nephrocystin 3-like N-terminal domain-containing protein n=1 Tax=Chlamydomonas incerta TaxID=51695 RepID=A0A835T7E7_CHLIN|nr:hypothetical protein HXX76_004413 [Chlamydomonas incerta]|eukprot:KAG2440302.1 hypothetical protein HXX76_004413 [Chlamydomonas incerta]